MAKWAPWGYQLHAVKFMLSHGSAGIFLDPGLGKTSIVLATYKILKSQGLADRMLVIAPLRPAFSVWPVQATLLDDFHDLSVDVLHGPDKAEKLALGADVQVINYDGLGWLFSQKLKEWPWDVLVCDEATSIKHTNTRRFRLLKPHLGKFRRRYALTGSPAPNGLLDLFGQIYVLDMGNALGRFITSYRSNYFDSTGYGGYTFVPRRGAVEAIQERLKPLVLRMEAADYLSLPPLINNTVEVELPEKARKIYRDMENLLLAELESGTVVAANAAAATIKLRQIANGGLYHADGSTWSHVHDAKTDATVALTEELSGQPALIAFEFHHDRLRLDRAYGSPPYLGGDLTPRQQRETIAAWCAGEIPVLLAQARSAALGINLQRSNAAIILHSLTYDLETYEQLIRRIWRQGQKTKVVVHHIVAKDTVDELIMRALAKKTKTQRNLLEDLKAHLRRRTA